MFQLVYASKALVPFGEIDLAKLASQASEKNKYLEITGFLNYRKGRFLQFLEGEEESLLALMDTIRDDERHIVAKELHFGGAPQRLFGDWNMKYLPSHYFCEIQLEDILESTLLHMVGGPYEEDKVRALLLRMISSVVARETRRVVIR